MGDALVRDGVRQVEQPFAGGLVRRIEAHRQARQVAAEPARGDGIARARAEGSPQRFYSLSAQIQRSRRDYYEVLERTQKGTLDVTEWLSWFLAQLRQAIADAHIAVDGVLFKARFWRRWAGTPMNERQIKLLNRLLDGFEGKLTSSKWAVIAKCSPDTALRDITELMNLGALRKTPGGGRSTGYELAPIEPAM